MTTQATTLETTVCTRCCGTGKFSFNMIDGDRCYGCSGAGKVYTKRGKVAKQFLDALRTVNVTSLKVGDRFIYAGYKRLVVNIEIDLTKANVSPEGYTQHQVKIETTASTSFFFADTTVTKIFTPEEMNAQLKQAIEFQNTLTKTGTVRKIK